MAPADHSRFERYVKWTTDPSWKNFFRRLATGAFPEGTKFSNETIILGKRKLTLLPDDCSTSEHDNCVNIRKFFEPRSDTKKEPKKFIDEWKSIKSKEAKHHMVLTFSKMLVNENSLKVTAQTLTNQILFYIQLKIIGSSDIILSEGKISEISSIKIKKKKVIFPAISEISGHSSNSPKIKKNLMKIQIEKMIKENENRLEKIL
jgi:hypothetical protein